MSARGERTLFAVLASFTFVYIALRALLVPITHDEAATFQTYVLTGRYLPYIAHWDAGNHLLTTAVGRCCYLLFGPSPLSLRAFSVLCFAWYAWYAWRITRQLDVALVRVLGAMALLLCPFLLDFFSLFRGYGPSLAFLSMALFHGTRWGRSGKRADFLLLLLALLLANLASLTLLIIWCLASGLALIIIIQRHRSDSAHWAAWCTLGLAPLLSASHYSMELASRGLLYYGTPDGLLRGTWPSLSEWVLGTGKEWALGLVWLAPVALALIAWRGSQRFSAMNMLLVIVLGELAGRAVLGAGLGILYPMDRTAMHLVPLLILLGAFGLDALCRKHARLRWAAMLLLWLPLRTAAGLNLDHTRYWPEQAIPDEFYEAVLTRQKAENRPLLVGGYRQNPRAWAYGSMRHGGTLNFLDDTGFPQPTCDLLLIDPEYFTAPSGFNRILRASHGRAELLVREPDLRTMLRLDSTWAVPFGKSEFAGIWSPNPMLAQGREWLVELDVEMISDVRPLELRLVLEVKDSLGAMLHYDVVDLEDLGADWTTRPAHVLRRLPRFTNPPGRIACYLWNPRLQRFAADRVSLRVHEVLPN